MNSLIAEYRKANPQDTTSDAELMDAFGQYQDQDGRFGGYLDFVQQHNERKEFLRQASRPTLGEEFGRGLSRGTDSLLSTGVGALALASAGTQKATGIDTSGVTQSLLQKANEYEENAAQKAPSIDKIEDVKNFSDFTQWMAGKTGEIVPNVAEAVGTAAVGSAIGAAIGTAAEPVGGTAVGAGVGAIEGLVERAAIKSLIKKFAAEGMEFAIEKQGAKELVAKESKAIAQRYGAEILNGINFTAQSSGGIYNELTKKQGVDPDTAINTAIFGGLAAAIPAQFLPHYVTGKIFKGVTPEALPVVKGKFYQYLSKTAQEAAKTVPGGVAAMDMTEFATIAATKYATNEKWSDEDWSRLINASATGGIMGAISAPMAAMGGGKPAGKQEGKAEAKTAETKQPESKPQETSKALTITVDPAVAAYMHVDPSTPEGQRKAQSYISLARKSIDGELKPEDESVIKSFSEPERQTFERVRDHIEKQRVDEGNNGQTNLLNPPSESAEPAKPATASKVTPELKAQIEAEAKKQGLPPEAVAAQAKEEIADHKVLQQHPELAPSIAAEAIKLGEVEGVDKSGQTKADALKSAAVSAIGEESQPNLLDVAKQPKERSAKIDQMRRMVGDIDEALGKLLPSDERYGILHDRQKKIEAELNRLEKEALSEAQAKAPDHFGDGNKMVEQPVKTGELPAQPTSPSTPLPESTQVGEPITKRATLESVAAEYGWGIRDGWLISSNGNKTYQLETKKGRVRFLAKDGHMVGSIPESKPENLGSVLEKQFFAKKKTTSPATKSSDGVSSALDKTGALSQNLKQPSETPMKGDEVEWIDGSGHKAISTVEKVDQWAGESEPMAYVDHFGSKRVPLSKLTLRRKSNARISEEAAAAKKAAEPAPAPIKETWQTSTVRTPEFDEQASKDYKKAHNEIEKAKEAQQKIKPTASGFTKEQHAEYAKHQKVIEAARETKQKAEKYASLPKAKAYELESSLKQHFPDLPESTVKLVKDSTEFPAEVIAEAQKRGVNLDRIEAFAHKGTVYVNAAHKNVTPERLPSLVLHEAAIHVGLRKAMGETKWGSFLDNVYGAMTEKERAAIAKLQKLDLSTPENRRIAGEEFLAKLAENAGVKGNALSKAWDKAVRIFNQLYRSLGGTKDLSAAEVRDLVRKGMAEVVGTKEPWQMTKAEVVERDKKLWREHSTEAGQNAMLTAHKFHVRDAIREGKQVPAEVLADYPELASVKKKGDSEGVKFSANSEHKIVKLEKDDVEEVLHKLNNLADNEDLLDDYSITKEEVESIIKDIPLAGGEWRVEQKYFNAIKGELLDHVEVLRDIASDARGENKRSEATKISKQASRIENIANSLESDGEDTRFSISEEAHSDYQSELALGKSKDEAAEAALENNPETLADQLDKGITPEEIIDHAKRQLTQPDNEQRPSQVDPASVPETDSRNATVEGKDVGDVGKSESATTSIAPETAHNRPVATDTTRSAEGSSESRDQIVDRSATRVELDANGKAILPKDFDFDPREVKLKVSGNRVFNERLPLGSVIEAKDLFSKFPTLKDIPVSAEPMKERGHGAEYDPVKKAIGVGTFHETPLRRALIHEIQHAIDDKLGRGQREEFADRVEGFESAARSAEWDNKDRIKTAARVRQQGFEYAKESSSQTFERVENGKVVYDHVADVDEVAADFNDANAIRFSIADENDPSPIKTDGRVKGELRIAQYNFASNLLKKVEGAAEKLGLMSYERRRDKLVAQYEKAGIKVNRDVTIDGFKHRAQIDRSEHDAAVTIQKLESEVAAKHQKAQLAIEKAKAKLDDTEESFNLRQRERLSTSAISSHITRKLRTMQLRLQRDISHSSYRLGEISQQLKNIDPRAIVSDYADAFKKLFTGDQLKGEKLFDTMEKFALDPNVDFSKPAIEIWNQIKTRSGYKQILDSLGGDKEGKAFIATIVAFGKVHGDALVDMGIRRMENGVEREILMKQLAADWDTLAQTNKTVRTATRASALAERARMEYNRAKAVRDNLKKQIAHNQDVVKAAEDLAPILADAHTKLVAKQQIAPSFDFKDGAVSFAPENPNANHEQLLASKFTVRLTGKKLTDPAEIERNIAKQTRFLQAREERASKGDLNALDADYQAIKKHRDEIAYFKNFSTKTEPGMHILCMELTMAAVGKMVKGAFGSTAARHFERMVNNYVSETYQMIDRAKKIGQENIELESAVLDLLPKGIYDNPHEWLRDHFLNPAKQIMQTQHDLEEMFHDQPERLRVEIYKKVRADLESREETQRYMEGKSPEIMKALRKLLDFQHEQNQWFLQQVIEGKHGVADETLKVRDLATGKETTATRRHNVLGAYNFSQAIGRKFSNMVHALNQSGWGKDETNNHVGVDVDFARIKDLLDKGEDGKAELDSIQSKYFGNAQYGSTVREEFVRALVQKDGESPFSAPKLEDGVTELPADDALVKEAYKQSGGNIVDFASKLFDLHEGTGDRNQYIHDTFKRLAEIYHRVNAMDDRMVKTSTDGRVSVRGMTSNKLIDARSVEDLPGVWFNYHSFDLRDALKTIEGIASQNAFGREQARLDEMIKAVEAESDSALKSIDIARDDIMRQNPVITDKEMEAALAAKLGGKEQYEKLKKLAENKKYVGTAVSHLSHYFRRDLSPDGTLAFGTRIAGTMGKMLVNNPASAIMQFSALTDIGFKFGFSGTSLKTIGTATKITAQDIAGSFAQALGITLSNNRETHERYLRLGHGDPAAFAKLRNAFVPLQGEGRGAHVVRAIDELVGFGLNRVGHAAQYTVFRPMQAFTSAAMLVNKALTESVWKMADLQVMRGIEHAKENPHLLNDPAFKITSETLGLRGAEKDTFDRFASSMARFDIDYTDLVRDALNNEGRKGVLSDDAYNKLYALTMSDVSNEGNLSTMSAGAANNGMIRFMMPLVGWSFRRALDTPAVLRTEEGRYKAQTIMRGIAGIGVAAMGGMAVSVILDEYYKDLLGKERNLRPIIGASDAGEMAAGIMENLNRAGTIGLLGELVNAGVNVGTGADNRGFSVDQRVVGVSALQNLFKVASARIHMGESDYAHVVRPLIQSAGGGGLLQYMQMANKALGLDNAESRVTARMNAQNYLRVVGRSLDMEVRQMSGNAAYTPTEMTPWLTRLEMAAYGNNPSDFNEAYAGALRAAKEAGHDDPAGYIRRAFASRHPLRNVFRTPPDEAQYRKILATLDDDGRRDTLEAIGLFNAYGERLGVHPFNGKAEKSTTPTAKTSPADLRLKGLEALRTGSFF